jgi:hypothetical protein
MLVEDRTRLVEVHLGDRRVDRPATADQDMVDRRGHIGEESAQPRGVAQIEGRGRRLELLAYGVEPPLIPAGDHEPGVGRVRLAGRLQTDAGGAADDDDGAP